MLAIGSSLPQCSRYSWWPTQNILWARAPMSQLLRALAAEVPHLFQRMVLLMGAIMHTDASLSPPLWDDTQPTPGWCEDTKTLRGSTLWCWSAPRAPYGIRLPWTLPESIWYSFSHTVSSFPCFLQASSWEHPFYKSLAHLRFCFWGMWSKTFSNSTPKKNSAQ